MNGECGRHVARRFAEWENRSGFELAITTCSGMTSVPSRGRVKNNPVIRSYSLVSTNGHSGVKSDLVQSRVEKD